MKYKAFSSRRNETKRSIHYSIKIFVFCKVQAMQTSSKNFFLLLLTSFSRVDVVDHEYLPFSHTRFFSLIGKHEIPPTCRFPRKTHLLQEKTKFHIFSERMRFLIKSIRYQYFVIFDRKKECGGANKWIFVISNFESIK